MALIHSKTYLEEICKIGQGKETCRYLVCGLAGCECAKKMPTIKARIDAAVVQHKIIAEGDNCNGFDGDVCPTDPSDLAEWPTSDFPPK